MLAWPDVDYTKALRSALTPWEDCLFYAVDYAGILDHGSLTSPIFLETAQGCKSISDCLVEKRRSPKLMTLSLRNIKCYLLLVSADDDVLERLDTGGDAYPPLAKTIQQNVYPQYIIILSPQESFVYDPDKYTSKLVTIGSFGVLSSLPPVFIFLYSKLKSASAYPNESVGTGELKYGYFFCWYCEAGPNQFFDFDCPIHSDCTELMLETYFLAIGGGKNVKWGFVDTNDVDSIPPFKKTTFCVFPSHSSKSCVRDLSELAVVNFLFEPLNSTVLMYPVEWEVNYIQLEYFPTVHTLMDRQNPGHCYFYKTGFTLEHRFITADGVQSDNTSLDVYVKPFKASLWYALLCMSVILAILWTAAEKSPLRRTTGGDLLWNVVRVITLQQEGPAPVPEKLSLLMTDPFRIVLVVLMLISTIVSNAYRGFVGCNQLLTTKNSTKWRNLQELDDFTLYFAFESPACHVLSNGVINISSKAFCKFVSFAVNETLAEPCIAAKEMRNFVHSKMISEQTVPVENRSNSEADEYYWNASIVGDYLDRYFSALESMQQRLKFFCIDDIDKVIQQKLSRKKTALVTTVSNSIFRWERFQNAMGKNQKLKFAHNFDVDDDAFRWPAGYYISDGLDRAHNGVVHDRMRVLLSAGLYSLWEKWMKIRKERALAAQMEENKVHFMPISFRTSDVHLVFVLFLFLLVVCILVFLSQFILYHVLKKIRRAYLLKFAVSKIVRADIRHGLLLPKSIKDVMSSMQDKSSSFVDGSVLERQSLAAYKWQYLQENFHRKPLRLTSLD